MKFLTAKWEHLLLANYVVEPTLLQPYVPRGTRLDAFEGRLFVSLVAFMFNQTRVLGVPVPFHRNFEEVNLRFYVVPESDPSRRAVTFIQEIVPRKIIPWVSNSLFNEHYVAVPMAHRNASENHWYAWKAKGERTSVATTTQGTCDFQDLPDRASHHIVAAKIQNELVLPAAGSVGEFITEHYWGYAQGKSNTLEYHVEHPQWQCCEVADFHIDVDFAMAYGDRFAFLTEQQPYNVLYARGSDVSVSLPSRYRVPS